mmetsp:Transcript_23977/g.57232  ORF Transcript_23977/g.57232 Transcript_23977/m.57232 type:complete len:219 (-) Transcript_23977:355-1011(-)
MVVDGQRRRGLQVRSCSGSVSVGEGGRHVWRGGVAFSSSERALRRGATPATHLEPHSVPDVDSIPDIGEGRHLGDGNGTRSALRTRRRGASIRSADGCRGSVLFPTRVRRKIPDGSVGIQFSAGSQAGQPIGEVLSGPRARPLEADHQLLLRFDFLLRLVHALEAGGEAFQTEIKRLGVDDHLDQRDEDDGEVEDEEEVREERIVGTRPRGLLEARRD